MKIDGNRTADTQAAGQTSRTGAEAGTRRSGTAAGRPAADRVELSGDAALLATALSAAAEAPAIRLDRVEQARLKLESGELGADAGRLADALIDDLLS